MVLRGVLAASGDYRQRLADVEAEARVREPQSAFGLFRRASAGEDEAEISRALGQRLKLLALLRRHLDFCDTGDLAGLFDPFGSQEHAGSWDRDHHDAVAAWREEEARDVFSEGVEQKKLFEGVMEGGL